MADLKKDVSLEYFKLEVQAKLASKATGMMKYSSIVAAPPGSAADDEKPLADLLLTTYHT